MGYHCDEFRLMGAADVHEVLDWASASARPGHSFTLCIEHLQQGRPGLIHLAGVDPTAER